MQKIESIIHSSVAPTNSNVGWINSKGILNICLNGIWQPLTQKNDSLINITWLVLKELRDGGKLTPGQQYRITDYHCTTTQEDTQSADHQFDIIVTADTADTLNENARACLHEGDTYFSSNNADLAAWELKYSIDNDDTKYAWADDTNGKGVIYWMKDEWNNECPYDFKNILFARNVSLENGYPELDNENGEETFVHTFCANSYHLDNDEWSSLKDGSLESPYGHESDEHSSTFHNNVIKEYRMLYDNEDEDYTKCGKQYLNDIVMFGYWEEKGSTEYEYPYYYAYCCYSNTFGDYCYSNTFGNGCYSNTFGNNCDYNTFGNGCYSNTFGNNCDYNTFGAYCYYNTFGNYMQWCSFEDGVKYVATNCSTGSSAYLKNMHVLNGTQGTSSSNKLTISITANRSYCTYVGKNASGTLKIWCPADLVN